MKVNLFAVMVLRSMDTHLQVAVPHHEIELLAAVHGSDAVGVLSQDAVGELTLGAVFEERDRLRAKYGATQQGVPFVDAVYPNDSVLIAAAKAGMAQAQGGQAMSRDEMKAVLDGLGVEYKGNASTETLAALVAEHAPAV